MYLLSIDVKGLPLFKGDFNVDFFASKNVMEIHKERLCHLFSTSAVEIYKSNAICFVGINASGKTTALRTISFIIELLNGRAIGDIQHRNIINGSSNIEITSYMYDGACNIYKVFTRIMPNNGTECSYRICEEYIYRKKISSVKSKKTLLDFDDKIEKSRNGDMEYLKDDASIAFALTKNNSISSSDLTSFTNTNIPVGIHMTPDALLKFLDPSIEYIKFEEGKEEIRLKFYNKDEIIVANFMVLENYLSSGTIKGMTVFRMAMYAFYTKGYLIVDEIEKHFNKEITVTLIRYFLDKDVNRNGATLIYSTHYIELLDELDRNDSIYIMRNDKGIYADNLNNILKRNDIKKSETFFSDYLKGTAPKYNPYINLKMAMSKIGSEIK